MKTLLGALALIIAAPVAAQTAPVADPHAGHSQEQHKGTAGDGQHKDCCKDGCCEKMKQSGEKMDCCEGKDAQHQSHDKK